jgi:hypothetical protein
MSKPLVSEVWEIARTVGYGDGLRSIVVRVVFVGGWLSRVSVEAGLVFPDWPPSKEVEVDCSTGSEYAERCVDFALDLAESLIGEYGADTVRRTVEAVEA